MKPPNIMLSRFALGLALTGCLSVAPIARAQTQDSATKPDNSAQNKNHQDLNADKQPNAKADRELTASIRKAIIADKGLSTYAHNVKIIARGNTVILKGPVKSDEEKQKVKADALNAAAQAQVVDQLTVKN